MGDRRNELEQQITSDDPRSHDVRISCQIDGQDLYNILVKLHTNSPYSLSFHEIDITNAKPLQNLISEDYVEFLYICKWGMEEDHKNILRYFLEGLRATTVLHTLQLDGKFTEEEYAMIDNALSSNKSITDLQISAPLFNTLKVHPAISKLEISMNITGDIDNGEYITRIFEGLEQSKTIKSFKLTDRSFDNDDWRVLKLTDNNCIAAERYLSNSIALEHFYLDAKADSLVGCEHLANGLAKNKSISSLKLTHLHDDGTSVFSRIFKENKRITNLDLVHNGSQFKLGELITDQSAIKILGTRRYDESFLEYAISPNCRIEELFLSLSVYHHGFNPDLDKLIANNKSVEKFRIESDAPKHSLAFANGLLKNNTITHIKAYFDDPIPEDASLLLLEYLKNSTSLLSFELTGYGFLSSAKIHAKLMDVIKTNTTLEKLYMPYLKNYGDKTVDVTKALSDNRSLTDVNWISPYQADLAEHFLPNNEALLKGGFADRDHPILIRNRKLRVDRIVLVYNMARSPHFLSLLPVEIRHVIFGHLSFPGIKSKLVVSIFEEPYDLKRKDTDAPTYY